MGRQMAASTAYLLVHEESCCICKRPEGGERYRGWLRLLSPFGVPPMGGLASALLGRPLDRSRGPSRPDRSPRCPDGTVSVQRPCQTLSSTVQRAPSCAWMASFGSTCLVRILLTRCACAAERSFERQLLRWRWTSNTRNRYIEGLLLPSSHQLGRLVIFRLHLQAPPRPDRALYIF